MLSIPAVLFMTCAAVLPGASHQDQHAASSRDLGFEAGTAGEAPADWFVPTAGWVAELSDTDAAEGKLCAVLVKPGESPAPFGNLLRSIDAGEYQGRHVTLSARIRVEGEGGWAQMWLRADRPAQQVGAFDNMGDRPIRAGGWTNARIEVDVDADAVQLVLGFMSFGGATLFVDAVKLEAGGMALRKELAAPRTLTPRGLLNVAAAARLLAYVRFFHPSDQAVAVQAWDHLAIQVIEQAEPATDPADLARRLQESFAPLAPTLVVWAGGAEQAPPASAPPQGARGLAFQRNFGAGSVAQKDRPNAYSSTVIREELSAGPGEEPRAACFRDKLLGESGVWCRLPIEIYYDEEGTLPHASVPAEWSSRDGKPRLTALDRSTRLAGVSLCWGVMQHFYPYFDVVETDWDAALDAALSKAARDEDEHAYLRTLNELIAKLHDGHGVVWSPTLIPQTRIPLALAWAGEDLVIVGKHGSVPAGVKVGDVILSMDGKTTSTCYEELSRAISAATDGWQRHASLRAIELEMPTSDPVSLGLRHPDGSEYSVSVARMPSAAIEDATNEKPADGAELVPGIFYFDLDGAQTDALTKVMPVLSSARGIVFDMRGYPNSAAMELLKHLIDQPATSARWNIPIVTLPDREGWTEWNTSGRWDLQPIPPRLATAVAFLTDGRAISYAESIMGIVEAYGLGEIVGATTAGTNGNINPFVLPGGYSVSWTGMRVLKHDGSQHHGIGIRPTVPVVPTAQGIAEGRDEVLEKAVDILAAKLARGER